MGGVEGESFDLLITPGHTEDFSNAETISGVKSPYTHVKPNAGEPFSYRLVAKFPEGDLFSSVPQDIPEGDLATCLAAEGAVKATLDQIFANSQIQDCYLYVDTPEILTQLNLNELALTDLSPLSRLVNLEV